MICANSPSSSLVLISRGNSSSSSCFSSFSESDSELDDSVRDASELDDSELDDSELDDSEFEDSEPDDGPESEELDDPELDLDSVGNFAFRIGSPSMVANIDGASAADGSSSLTPSRSVVIASSANRLPC
jgi:hypothetical protein